jgi:hypothetical protein
MSKLLAAIVASISLVSLAHAQGKLGDVTMSSDPAKAAAVEQQVAELKAQHTHRTSHVSRHALTHRAKHVSAHSSSKTNAAAVANS